MRRETLTIDTRGRGFVELTARVRRLVEQAGVADGLCHVFVHHTSASLIVTENADPDVRRDLEMWLSSVVVDGDPRFVHTAEGPDDMSAHVRAALLPVSLSIPIDDGRLALGTWQGVFLWEHRAGAHQRRVSVIVQGFPG